MDIDLFEELLYVDMARPAYGKHPWLVYLVLSRLLVCRNTYAVREGRWRDIQVRQDVYSSS